MVERVESTTTTYVLDIAGMFEQRDRGKKVSGIIADYIKAANLRPDFIVGHHLIKENAADHNREYPLVEIVSPFLNKPYSKLYEREVDGEFFASRETPRGKVLIVDGAVRTGNSILRVANYLRSREGLEVQDAVVVVARPDGDNLIDLKSNLFKQGINLHYMITAKQIVDNQYKKGQISNEKYAEIMSDEDFN